MYQEEHSNNKIKKVSSGTSSSTSYEQHHVYRLFFTLKDVNTGTLDFVLLNLTGIDSLATHHK